MRKLRLRKTNNMQKELWKDIVGYEGLYQVSNLGQVKSFHIYSKGRILKSDARKDDYLYVTLCKGKDRYKKSYRIHRLVLLAFLGSRPTKKEGNHINGIKSDNSLKNLEWMTSKQNTLHAMKIGLVNVCGEDSPTSKLKVNQVREIRRSKKTKRELAENYGVGYGTISCIINYKTWKFV